MSKKVLIANRGEISLRAIRACKELGLKTVCIYSEGDKELKSLRFSNESVCVGPADPTKSYLDAPTILSAEDAHKRFDPKNVNPTYEEDIKFRKLNE